MSSGPIHVLTLADGKYALPLAVAVRSLLEHHQTQRPLTITVVDGGLSPEDKARLGRSWNGATSSPAHWRFVPPLYPENQHLPVWGRVPKLTYARLVLPDYFLAGESRAVLMDPDVLVLAGIDQLFDIGLHGVTAAACADPFIPTVSAVDGLATWKELGLARNLPYFNAGIMLADLARWRSRRIAERAISYISSNVDRLRQYDQDALNAVLLNDWLPLDPRWHVHPRAANALGAKPRPEPGIVHFSGRLKPWLYSSPHPADRLFSAYLQRTEWRSTAPPVNFRALAYRLYDSPLRRLGHPLEVHAAAWLRRLQQKP